MVQLHLIEWHLGLIEVIYYSSLTNWLKSVPLLVSFSKWLCKLCKLLISWIEFKSNDEMNLID